MLCVNKKLNYLIVICFAFLSAQSFACTITYSSSSDSIKRTMDVGFDWNGGWNFNKYDNVCKKLEKNNAALHLSGMIWEHEKDNYIAYYVLSIMDKKSSLVSADFGRNGVIIRNKYSNPTKIYTELFAEINNNIDTWYAEGSFDSAVKRLHERRMEIREMEL